MVHALSDTDLPLYPADPDSSSWHYFIEEGSILYVQVNEHFDRNAKIKATAKEIKQLFADRDVEAVVVDLRFNSGGNLLLTSGM